MLCDPVFCCECKQYAHDLLTAFVKQSAEIYGPGFLFLNVHCLVHLAAEVQLHGNLDNFSAFRFENFLKQLKQMVKKAHLPLPQIVRRIGEKSAAEKSYNKCISDFGGIHLSGEHYNGPVPAELVGARQFSQLRKPGMTIALNDKDCCVLNDHAQPHIVQNILLHNGSHFLVCQSFRRVSDLFNQPLPSSGVRIYKVSRLHASHTVIAFSENTQKCAFLPLPTTDSVSNRTAEFAVLPLLHGHH